MNAPIIETPIRLTLTRSFDASPQRLFEAWLSPAFGTWLGTEDVTCVSCAMDARIGGAWKLVHRGAGGIEMVHQGVYKQIEPFSKLAFTWSGGCGGPHITLVTVSFKAKGAGTEMTLAHEGFLEVENAERHEGGWSASFTRLARYLAG